MQESLLEFHKKWYSSNIMHLVVLSNHSIEDLETWAVDKFSKVTNFDVEVPYLGDPAPFPEGYLCKQVKYIPV